LPGHVIFAFVPASPSLLTGIGQAGKVTSGSVKTTLSPTSSTIAIFTSSNSKVGAVSVSINATASSRHDGTLTVRYYTDPSNPNVYVQQTVVTDGSNPGGFLGTGTAWKVMLVDTFPGHSDHSSSNNPDTVTLARAYSSIASP